MINAGDLATATTSSLGEDDEDLFDDVYSTHGGSTANNSQSQQSASPGNTPQSPQGGSTSNLGPSSPWTSPLRSQNTSFRQPTNQGPSKKIASVFRHMQLQLMPLYHIHYSCSSKQHAKQSNSSRIS